MDAYCPRRHRRNGDTVPAVRRLLGPGRIHAVCIATAVALSAATWAGSPASASRREASTSPQQASPCGGSAAPPAVYDHVIWIWMENKPYHQVIGSSQAPYETSIAGQCATATNYSSVGSPSLPNYIGATSGSTQGISDDAPPSAHRITADNLFRQVRARGGTARSFEESMKGACNLGNSGRYAVKHNPAAYYVGDADRAACRTDDIPLGSLQSGALRRDIDANTLPTFAFVTPNLCNDTHDCSVSTGDRWLEQLVPLLVASDSYTAGKTAIFVVWDEDSPVPFIALAPSVPAGTVERAKVDHYALLRTTEEMLGIPTRLAAAARAPSMRASLHL
jgi:phospholipase C